MLNVSNRYIEATNASFREYKALVLLHLSGKKTYPFASGQATSSSPGYSTNAACDGRIFLSDHICAGSYLPTLLRSPSQGWKGANVSDEDGNISETYTVRYLEKEELSTVFFKAVDGGIPKDFVVKANGVTIAEVTDNVDALWYYKLSLPISVNNVSIEISAMSEAEVNVHLLEFGSVRTLVIDDNEIIDFKVVAETKPPASTPIGGTSANELTITFNNENKWFTQNVKDSLLNEYIKPGTCVQVYTGLSVSDDTFEYVPCGEYYAADWDAPSSSLEASLAAYDILHTVGNKPVPVMPVYIDTDVGTLIRNVLIALGVPAADIIIDPRVRNKVNVGWVPNGNGFDAINTLSIAGHATIATTFDFKVKVFYNFIDEDPIRDWHDDNQIIDLSNPVVYNNVYDAVKVSYAKPSISEYTEIASINDIDVQPGITTIDNVSLGSDFPTSEISKVEILGASDVVLQEASFGAWDGSMVLMNSSNENRTISITLYGRVVTLASLSVSTDNGTADKIIEVESNLIQDIQTAKQFSRGLLAYVIDPAASYSGGTRGDLSVGIMDTVTIRSDIDNMHVDKVVITSQTITYSGGIDVDITARKPIVPKEYVFIAPGVVIYAPIKLH